MNLYLTTKVSRTNTKRLLIKRYKFVTATLQHILSIVVSIINLLLQHILSIVVSINVRVGVLVHND